MLNEADVGISIQKNSTSEGSEAIYASDYSIPEISGLEKMIFVHGKWAYIRMTECLLHLFFKSILFVFPHVFLASYSWFSG